MTVIGRCLVATPLIVRRASRVVDEWREGFSGRLNPPNQIQSIWYVVHPHVSNLKALII
jgi:hypothetical protein